MRRIIENYFQILGGFSPEYILEKFDVPEERKICRSLLSWVNDGSHSFPDDIFVELSEEQLGRHKAVFKKIFEKMNQLEHYEMMMRPVTKEGESSVSTEES
jgi:wobble nucleotide-excising tRNase